MKNVSKMRRSKNIEDMRGMSEGQKNAKALGEVVQRVIDSTVMAKAEADTMSGDFARQYGKKLSQELDAWGDKGKGRLGGGRVFSNRLEKAYSRQPKTVKLK